MEEKKDNQKTPLLVISEHRAMILTHCKIEIDRILSEHGCKLVGIPEISDGRIVASVAIELDGSRI